MPAGNKSTGWNTPNTPGSIAALVQSIGRDALTAGPGCAARTTRSKRTHRVSHTAKTARVPASHTTPNTAGPTGNGEGSVASAADTAAGTSLATKGCAAARHVCGSGSDVGGLHAKCFPSVASGARGTRNLSEAAVHTQKRTRAW